MNDTEIKLSERAEAILKSHYATPEQKAYESIAGMQKVIEDKNTEITRLHQTIAAQQKNLSDSYKKYEELNKQFEAYRWTIISRGEQSREEINAIISELTVVRNGL